MFSMISMIVAAAVSSRAAEPPADAGPPLRLAVAGMVHGHVEGVLSRAARGTDVTLVGVYEPDGALFQRLAAKYGIDPSLRFDDLAAMLERTSPEAVSVMTAIADHRLVAEACAPRGVHMLFEKPLAFSNTDAQRIAALARANSVLALTNFETSWYTSVREAGRLIDSGAMGPVRRMVFRHGHKGPREIGCTQEFLAWLTDPERNGGGAIVDFGCYGAVLATWLMDGQRPASVTATAATHKPLMYPRVDDDATIVLTYPGATAVIQASWCWTHDNKEMDVFAEKGSIHAGKWADLRLRDPDAPPRTVEPVAAPEHLRDEWVYLRRVVRGQCAVDPLSDLETNLIAVEILDAAREQVRRKTGS
jgi:predicted dehydrogenase